MSLSTTISSTLSQLISLDVVMPSNIITSRLERAIPLHEEGAKTEADGGNDGNLLTRM